MAYPASQLIPAASCRIKVCVLLSSDELASSSLKMVRSVIIRSATAAVGCERVGWWETERWNGAEHDETNGGSNIAAQNSRSNPTKQITPNFLGDSYARCPFTLRIPGNLDQREPASSRAGISRLATFHLTTPVLPAPLFHQPDRFADAGLRRVQAWFGD